MKIPFDEFGNSPWIQLLNTRSEVTLLYRPRMEGKTSSIRETTKIKVMTGQHRRTGSNPWKQPFKGCVTHPSIRVRKLLCLHNMFLLLYLVLEKMQLGNSPFESDKTILHTKGPFFIYGNSYYQSEIGWVTHFWGLMFSLCKAALGAFTSDIKEEMIRIAQTQTSLVF